MSTVPVRSTVPQRVPGKSRPRPARLRVLPGGAAAAKEQAAREHARRQRARSAEASSRLRFLIVSAVVLAALVFALVLLNILVVQRSFELGDLQSRVTKAQAEHRRMRFEVAKAESPARVAESAAGLGLQVPERQEYLLGDASLGPQQGLATAERERASDLREVEGRLKAVQGP